MSSNCPYNESWLNSCYQETLLPGSPWLQIAKAINANLAEDVKKLSLDSELGLCVLKELGPRFLNEYLTNHDIDQKKLQAINCSKDVQLQAQQWLREKLVVIVKQLRLKQGIYDVDKGEMSTDMMEYEEFVHQVVYRGLDSELALAEKKELHLHTQPFAVSSMLTGVQSETLGHAVSSLLLSHPTQLPRIARQLTGRPLPNSFRQLFWKIKIFKAENCTALDMNTCIHNLEEEFLNKVQWGQKELGVHEPVSSTVDGIVKHAVREIYSAVPCIQDGNMRHVCANMAIQALNVLYVHSRMYEPHYALLVLPLIWTYVGFTSYKEFTGLELAGLLYHHLQNCFPSRLDIFAIADNVVKRLQKNDPVLCNHLVETMKQNVAFNPREFLVNFIHHEKKKATSSTMANDLGEGALDGVNEESKSLLSHPIVFMRKWVSEGFVGVLDFPAILFVWDQCFLGNWQPVILENICLVLLELLRPKLINTNDYNDAKQVLLNHVYSLNICDIQQGLNYLCNGGSLVDVSGLREPSQVIQTPSLTDTTSSENMSGGSVTPSQDINLGSLWVENKPLSPIDSQQGLTNTESFHVYVDEVRFIPDNATVIKVTGRILSPLWKKPSSLDISDVEAYSILESPARCPKFHYRYPVHPGDGLQHDSVLLLRVYTLDVDTGEMLVVGNCALNLYKEKEPDRYILNTGGHQMRIKHELPSTVSQLSEELFTELTNIPVMSLLIRILPHSEDFIESPGYSSGYYKSTACKPSEIEWTIYQHYLQLQPYPPTVIEAIRDIREEELNVEDEEVTDHQMDQWYKQRMSKQQLERKPAGSIHLTKLVQYDQKQGLYFKVNQAFGLQYPFFTNVLAYVSHGPEARAQGKTEDGLGGEENTLFDKRDFTSLQKSPEWISEPKMFHPCLDNVSSLVIQLYGLDANYQPTADRQTAGIVTDKKGKTLDLVSQGWTVVKLFDKKCVNAGVHHIPLFEGKPSSSFMEFLLSYPGDVGIHEAAKQNIHQLQGSSCVQVSIWDGHFSKNSTYIPLQVNQDLLSIGNEGKINKAMQNTAGKRISDIVLQSLTRQERKLGETGHPYIQEQQHYEQAMNQAFNSLMDDVLLSMGLAPSSS